MRFKGVLIGVLFCLSGALSAQQPVISGRVVSDDGPLPYANVLVSGSNLGTTTDENGWFQLTDLKEASHALSISYVGYESTVVHVKTRANKTTNITVDLHSSSALNEVVVTGTMKEMQRLESPVPVEVYNPTFFKRNPTPSMYEALQNVNGVRPQLNCNVCNTGDIHINGLEGPYTMILIDGMPIVSGLASVYGLTGIPNSMIERIEIVKGPASSLYGSEAVGGLINLITKKPTNSPMLTFDVMATSWRELNSDVSFKMKAGKKAYLLTGINHFNYGAPRDNNGDNFTDVTLQNRISLFQKWSFDRNKNRELSLAGRYLYENRWGGEMDWNPEFRGGDSVYAESIYTHRWELIGKYQLPTSERIMFSFSYNYHDQNSVYGKVPFAAQQQIAFSQLHWNKKVGRHDFLVGTAIRYTYYDDNTYATADSINNQPSITWLPGVFLQNEIGLNERTTFLLGARYDHNSIHGNIWTPRVALKWAPNQKNIFRLNTGTGYRVVNLFTEEHAALTGARRVVVKEKLRPEQSINANLNYIRKFYAKNGAVVGLDATSWITLFTNQILPNYDLNPNEIVYDNLNGYGITRGLSLNADFDLNGVFKGMLGATYMGVFQVKKSVSGEEIKTRPILTEKWAGNWSLSYLIKKINTTVDYTGNLYGPMRLPALGPLDPRADYSPWWSIQNIQLTYVPSKLRWEIYVGVKNLLNFTPPSNSIARSNDPFDKRVSFDSNGNPVSTTNNPYALTFDPSYVYAPNQGIRGFLGFRYKLW